MADLQKLKARVLADGVIDEDDVDHICGELYRLSKIDTQVVQFLITLRNEAQKVCPLFQQFFFETVKFNVLADGRIDAREASWLGRMLFADDKVDEHELRFLWDLKRQAKWVCPEFQQLYDECMRPGRFETEFSRSGPVDHSHGTASDLSQ
jgi:hypothetical protein